MADSEDRKSAEAESESDLDEVAALQWTLRRTEATDDDEASDREEIKESYRSSATGDDGGLGCLSVEPEYDDEVSNRDDLEEFGEKGSELDREVIGGELENISQDEDEVREILLVKEKAESEEVFEPKSGWFYMHEDRSENRRYGPRRGTMHGVKLWDCANEQKWRHDKFEEMTLQDKTARKSHHQQQGKNQSKDHRYANTNKFESHGNLGYQNKTSRIVKGRGPIKYKPLLKRNNLNLLSKHQIPADIQERTPNSSSQRVSSHMPAISSDSRGHRMQQFASSVDSALPLSDSMSSSSHGILNTQRSNEQDGGSNRYKPTSTQKNDKHTDSLPNSCLQMKTIYKRAGSDASNIEESTKLVDDNYYTYQPVLFPILAESLPVGGKTMGLPSSTQQIYQPYSTHNKEYEISLPPLYPIIEQGPITSIIQTLLPLCSQQLTLHPGNDYQTLSKSLSLDSSVETLPQTSNFRIGLVEGGNGLPQGGRRGSFQHGGTPEFLPVMQLGGLPCGTVGDHAPWILASVEYVPQSQLGSRNCELTSLRVGTTRPCKINNPLADKSDIQR